MEGDDVMNTRLAIKESLKKLEEYASYLRYIYRYIPNILKKTTTLLNLQDMFRQKLLSSSVDRFTKR